MSKHFFLVYKIGLENHDYSVNESLTWVYISDFTLKLIFLLDYNIVLSWAV